MSVKKKDLVGQRFARWVVIAEGEDYVYPSGKKSFRWICKCDCGEEGLVHGSHLKNGTSQSCGCFNREQSSTHGLSQTRAYKAYGHMKRRCSENASPKDKELYFDKGIGVCQRWEDVVLFFQDMGECPDGFELERLDPTKAITLKTVFGRTRILKHRTEADSRIILQAKLASCGIRSVKIGEETAFIFNSLMV